MKFMAKKSPPYVVWAFGQNTARKEHFAAVVCCSCVL